jgi:hypothetical protein
VRPARLFCIVAGALLATAIVVVSGTRLVALLRGADPAVSVNEARFRRWADRDPPLVGRLEEAARALETGRAVVPVCVPECQADWFGTMATYALPRQAVVPAKTEGQMGSVFPTRVVRTRDEVHVEPRSGADDAR